MSIPVKSKVYIFQPETWQKGLTPVKPAKSQHSQPNEYKNNKIRGLNWDDRSVRPRTANSSIFGNDASNVNSLIGDEGGLSVKKVGMAPKPTNKIYRSKKKL